MSAPAGLGAGCREAGRLLPASPPPGNAAAPGQGGLDVGTGALR